MALILLVVAGACASDSNDTSAEGDDERVADTTTAAALSSSANDQEVGFATDAAAPEEAEDSAADADSASAEAPAEGGESQSADETTSADTDAAGQPLPPVPGDRALTGERIIKEGTVTVELEPGTYDAAFGQIISRAQTLGGHVAGTSSSTDVGPDEEILVSGQVTLRVPVQNFEDLLTSIGDAGTIVDRNITSQDVTAEFTDLESRRRNLQALEGFYLGLLSEATAIPDAIAVQQQLADIQSQIEQITGRLNLLQDRTSFSTLTVRLQELGATPIEPEPTGEPGGLAPYIDQAIDTFFTTVGALIVFLTFISPFLVLGSVGYLIWRGVSRGRRRDRDEVTTATPPRETEQPTTPTKPEPVDA